MRPLSGASARSGHVGLDLKKAAGTTEASQMTELDGERPLLQAERAALLRLSRVRWDKLAPLLW